MRKCCSQKSPTKIENRKRCFAKAWQTLATAQLKWKYEIVTKCCRIFFLNAIQFEFRLELSMALCDGGGNDDRKWYKCDSDPENSAPDTKYGVLWMWISSDLVHSSISIKTYAVNGRLASRSCWKENAKNKLKAIYQLLSPECGFVCTWECDQTCAE